MAGLSLQPWQWLVLAACWIAFFAAPAAWMARRARRDGEQVYVWTALVLVGSFLGILEYFKHRSVLKRRAAREARRRERGPAEPPGKAP